MPTIRLLAFATAADALGRGELEMEIASGTTVQELRQRLDAEHPGLRELWPRLAIAIDGRLAGPEAEIPDGAEVALLPPVSGGSNSESNATENATWTHLTDGPLDLEETVARVATPSRGAVVTFFGTVRNHHQGRPVERLDYDAYHPMAEATIARIVEELEAQHEDLAVAIVHRLGQVPAGQPSVLIATASPHRPPAYEASREALERLKKEVPIWKREHYADGGATWREEEPLGTSLSR